MDVLELIVNFLFGTFISLAHYLTSWWENAMNAGLEVAPYKLLGIFLVMTLVLGSGFASMTFAEMKFRNRALHFIPGVLFPVLYPILFFYLAPVVGKERKVDEEEELPEMMEEDVDAEDSTNLIPGSEFEKFDQPEDPERGGFPPVAVPTEMNQDFFSRISRSEDGSPAGPFILELADGAELEIVSITSAMPNVLAAEIIVDGESRTIRLPYEKINACRAI